MRQVNWNQVAEKAVLMSTESLIYTIKDCREAALASRGWNPENEGYYDDEASVYASELRRRERCNAVASIINSWSDKPKVTKKNYMDDFKDDQYLIDQRKYFAIRKQYN